MKPLTKFDRVFISIYEWKEIPITAIMMIMIGVFEWLIFDATSKQRNPETGHLNTSDTIMLLFFMIIIPLAGTCIIMELWKARKKEFDDEPEQEEQWKNF